MIKGFKNVFAGGEGLFMWQHLRVLVWFGCKGNLLNVWLAKLLVTFLAVVLA
jgi:hypothetical protein